MRRDDRRATPRRTRDRTRGLALLGACALAALTACGGPQGGSAPTPPLPATSTTPPEPGPPPAPASTTTPLPDDPARIAAARPAFAPCSRAEADPSQTNLRPSALTQEDRAAGGARLATLPSGGLVVEAATTMDIPEGVLGAGSGYAAAIGEPDGTLRVSRAALTAVPVSLAVFDSPEAGRRVAFVELRLAPTPPARWVPAPELVIGTDGGDGGILAIRSGRDHLTAEAAGAAVEDYFAAAFPTKDPQSWNQCLVRTVGGHVDGILFSTGWGDGAYPTYLGEDASGTVVSVVSFGVVLPWNLSGLPGVPPPASEVGP